MKNLKLLFAFLAGVALTLLFTTKQTLNINLPDLKWVVDGGVAGTLGLLALILVGAYVSHWFEDRTEETQKGAGGFFDFLKNLGTSQTDYWLGGVCGGLGRSTPIPSWVWRLCFAAAFLFYGSGLLAYVLLWIFVPDGNATGETHTEQAGATRKSFLEFLRHLRRSPTDCWLGGVCGGLAERTPTPSWIWRLAFAALFFCYGTGLLVYVLLWIFIPRRETKNQAAA